MTDTDEVIERAARVLYALQGDDGLSGAECHRHAAALAAAGLLHATTPRDVLDLAEQTLIDSYDEHGILPAWIRTETPTAVQALADAGLLATRAVDPPRDHGGQLPPDNERTAWAAKWVDGGHNPVRTEERARAHGLRFGTRPIRRDAGPWIYDDTGEHVYPARQEPSQDTAAAPSDLQAPPSLGANEDAEPLAVLALAAVCEEFCTDCGRPENPFGGDDREWQCPRHGGHYVRPNSSEGTDHA